MRNSLMGRLLLLAIFLCLDVAIVASIKHNSALLGPLAPFGIVSFAAFVGLGLKQLISRPVVPAFNKPLFVGHLVCIACVCAINLAALRAPVAPLQSSTGPSVLTGVMTTLILLFGIILLALACIPFKIWIKTIQELWQLCLYAIVAGALAWGLRFPFQSFWDSSSTAPGRVLQVMTFHAVKAVLRVFIPGIYVNAQDFVIGTPNFAIMVAEACSGLEGLGLVLVFTIVWLWYFRKETRFPQALLLVPIALAGVWLLNVARIAALVLIGNAGAGDVAMVGFHSQAGWIGFTLVAFTFSMLMGRLSWVRKPLRDLQIPETSGDRQASSVPTQMDSTAESSATGAYLVPFLAILAASFLSKSISVYFEWPYPIRFLAAASALMLFWPRLKRLDWRFGWLAPVTGIGIFVLWLGSSLIFQQWFPSVAGSNVRESTASGLAALSPALRWTWIAFRIAAAVITVPIAEELAFRGYLARRLVQLDFDALPFSSVKPLAIFLSSVAFALLSGRQWFAALIAGVAYAALMKRTNRLGDPIAAHATANLLLAGWVLVRGNYALW